MTNFVSQTLTASKKLKLFEMVWHRTHRDFRSDPGEPKAFMGYAKYGATIQTVENISDAELLEMATDKRIVLDLST